MKICLSLALLTFAHTAATYMTKYSNVRAMRALIKASLQAIFKSPSAIVFTIAFPLVFILVFGFLGSGSKFKILVASTPDTDSTSSLYQILHQVPVLKWAKPKDNAQLAKWLKEGDIVASIQIKENAPHQAPAYNVYVNAASTEVDKAQQLQTIIDNIVQQQDPEIRRRMQEMVKVHFKTAEVREYRTIDFILPGQLSFSLLASGVFGTAFVFYNLRQTLVLKRFFATPVPRSVIVISEGLSRMMFQLMGSIIIIAIGHYAFSFTLANGLVTFLQMLVLCAIGLLVFMGFGFIISSLAKSESAIPPLSNLITLPQFLLAGTFFSIDNFPKWLQPFCKALPLTYLNDALRKVSFEGANLWDVRLDILVLGIWGIALYALASRIFKWE